MGVKWVDSVISTHQLKYHIDSSVTGSWITAVREAIREFNILSLQHQLGVTYVESVSPSTETNGTNVKISLGSGNISFLYDGSIYNSSFSGNALHGLAQQVQIGEPPRIDKVFIFLPANPQMNTPNRGLRATGIGVMRMIALHELIHGCGLSNNDHSSNDVFNGYPSTDPGRTPNMDRIGFQVHGKYYSMPPTIFTSETAAKIRRLWE